MSKQLNTPHAGGRDRIGSTPWVRMLGQLPNYSVLYGGALLLAIAMGAALAYAQEFLGDSGPYILVGAILVAAVVVAILLEWRLGVLLLCAILPYEGLINAGPASPTKALALLTFISLALSLLTDQKLFERFLRLWRQPLTLAVFSFALWALASTLWASYQGAALIKAIALLGLFGLMMVVGMLEERYLVLLWTITTLSMVSSVPAGYVLPQNEDMATADRFSSHMDPNEYACLVAVVFFAAYIGLKQYRMMTYVLAPALLFGILASLSRTGLIALVAAPVLAAPLVPRLAARLGGRTLILYGLGAVVFAGIILVMPSVGEDVSGRFTTLSEVGNEETWSGRWGIWRAALQVIASHPLLGVGAGNFAYAALQYSTFIADTSIVEGGVAGVAHNMLLSVTSELGFVGLTLFLGMLFLAFRMVLPITRKSALGVGILVALVAFTIAGMALTWESENIGYILFGSILSLHLQQVGLHTPLTRQKEGIP